MVSSGQGGNSGRSKQKGRQELGSDASDRPTEWWVTGGSRLTDYSKGFGGRYGMEKDKVDKAAVGFDCQSQAEKHDSQKDYSVGFGGKFGVQRDRQDKSALGWDHQEELQPHASQTDYSKGFGGRYGVQKDRVDKVTGDRMRGKLAEEESRRQAEEERVRCQARESEPARWKGELREASQQLEQLRQEMKEQRENGQNVTEKLQTELQGSQSEIKAIKEEMNILVQQRNALQKQVEELSSELATSKESQQLICHKAQQDLNEAREVSRKKMLEAVHLQKILEEKRSQWEEVERQNRELQACLKSLEMKKSQGKKWSITT
ncbi:src substrate cortactin-like [Phaenicophaeus curvirostris]|uniref:src substrate cortactin-like n=1 Tax=Phaenicophaeus curvirostris TaxID=33595 RepID=UPI0037F0BBF4